MSFGIPLQRDLYNARCHEEKTSSRQTNFGFVVVLQGRLGHSPQFEREKVAKRRQRGADLNRRPFAQESSVYPPGLYASWWMRVEKSRSNHFGRPRTTCASIAALATQRHGAFVLHFSGGLGWEGQVSGERASLPGVRLLFPSALKIPAWLFLSPYWTRLHLGQYVSLEYNRRYFLGLGN